MKVIMGTLKYGSAHGMYKCMTAFYIIISYTILFIIMHVQRVISHDQSDEL